MSKNMFIMDLSEDVDGSFILGAAFGNDNFGLLGFGMLFDLGTYILFIMFVGVLFCGMGEYPFRREGLDLKQTIHIITAIKTRATVISNAMIAVDVKKLFCGEETVGAVGDMDGCVVGAVGDTLG